MLSQDELKLGSTFILQLRDAGGVKSQWVQTLCGDVARHWYEIYRTSDWGALRHEAAAVFQHAVSSEEAERVRKSGRCVVIRPPEVTVEQLAPTGDPSPADRTPGIGTGETAPLVLLDRDQLDARLVDGDRLQLVHLVPDVQPHCRVLYREEEVPMELFTEYRNLGLIRPVGGAGIYM